MPILCIGLDIRAGEIRKQVLSAPTLPVEKLQALATEISGSELFLSRSEDAVELFTAVEDSEKSRTSFSRFLVETWDISPLQIDRFLFTKDGPNAIRCFFHRTIGMRDSGELSLQVQPFREQFALARQAGLVGSSLSKLYQRGLWLAEKTRIEYNVQQSAITPASVVFHLAQKIFGDLQSRAVLVADNASECEPFVQKLTENHIGEILFADTGEGAGKLSDNYRGKLVPQANLASKLANVDLLLLFDEGVHCSLAEISIARIMQKRHNSPLLLVSFVPPATPKKKPDFSGHFNLFTYTSSDLDDIVNANLKEHQKVETSINRLIEREINSFFEWLNTNEAYRFGNLIGRSSAMQEIMELVARISHSDISVLIDGESGTGKELVAKAIHEHSARVNHPFIAVNCGAIPEMLLESELFGHVKGAFTGAVVNKKGLFEAANHGTIFLDEIGETSLSTQVKLLRFLQEGEIKPVGSNDTMNLNVRILAATNRDLEQMIEAGKFRQDLFYRLNVIQITLPPLRDRKEDILPLAEHFLKKYASHNHKTVYGLDEEAQKMLLRYPWQGNVRELENAIERAVALSSSPFLGPRDLPPTLHNHKQHPEGYHTGGLTLKEVEKRHIGAMLREHKWNYDLVTRILGIGRTTLWRKMKEYDLSSSEEESN